MVELFDNRVSKFDFRQLKLNIELIIENKRGVSKTWEGFYTYVGYQCNNG